MGNVPQPGIIGNTTGAFQDTVQTPQLVDQATLEPFGGGGGGFLGLSQVRVTGDGSTPYSTLAAALAALPSSGGEIIIEPTATNLAPLDLTGYNDISIRQLTWKGGVQIPAGSQLNGFTVVNCQRIKFKGIHIDGNQNNTNNTGSEYETVCGVRVGATTGHTTSDIEFEDCWMENCYYSGVIAGDGDVRRLKAHRMKFTDCRDNNFFCRPGCYDVQLDEIDCGPTIGPNSLPGYSGVGFIASDQIRITNLFCGLAGPASLVTSALATTTTNLAYNPGAYPALPTAVALGTSADISIGTIYVVTPDGVAEEMIVASGSGTQSLTVQRSPWPTSAIPAGALIYEAEGEGSGIVFAGCHHVTIDGVGLDNCQPEGIYLNYTNEGPTTWPAVSNVDPNHGYSVLATTSGSQTMTPTQTTINLASPYIPVAALSHYADGTIRPGTLQCINTGTQQYFNYTGVTLDSTDTYVTAFTGCTPTLGHQGVVANANIGTWGFADARGGASFGWQSYLVYRTGMIVNFGGSYYQAIADSLNQNPTTAPSYWRALTNTQIILTIPSGSQIQPLRTCEDVEIGTANIFNAPNIGVVGVSIYNSVDVTVGGVNVFGGDYGCQIGADIMTKTAGGITVTDAAKFDRQRVYGVSAANPNMGYVDIKNPKIANTSSSGAAIGSYGPNVRVFEVTLDNCTIGLQLLAGGDPPNTGDAVFGHPHRIQGVHASGCGNAVQITSAVGYVEILDCELIEGTYGVYEIGTPSGPVTTTIHYAGNRFRGNSAAPINFGPGNAWSYGKGGNDIVVADIGTATTLDHNSGVSAVTAATSVVITHSLQQAPSLDRIRITPSFNTGPVWITSIGATTFTVNWGTSGSGNIGWAADLWT